MKVRDLIRELQTFVVKYPDAADFPVVVDGSNQIVPDTSWKVVRAVLDRRTGENKLILE
jgi:hypothetical protein